MDSVELFSFLGFPARVGGRTLLVSRYISNRGSTAHTTPYARERFGKSVRWKPWVIIDVLDLEKTEELINRGTDAQVESWRVSQLSVCGMIAIIGALVASCGVTALQLPGLDKCHYIARGALVVSLILSMISVFFSGLQQTSFGRQIETKSLRLWLASGRLVNDKTGETKLRSSIVAHMILQAPFEIVAMAIGTFIVGLGAYLASSWHLELALSTGGHGNRAALIAYAISTLFALLMYGNMMGLKDREVVQDTDARDAHAIAEHLKSKKGSISADVEATAVQHLATGIRARAQSVPSEMDMLKDALQAAAEAQHKCAQANEEVARQYERLLEKPAQQ